MGVLVAADRSVAVAYRAEALEKVATVATETGGVVHAGEADETEEMTAEECRSRNLCSPCRGYSVKKLTGVFRHRKSRHS